MRSHFLITVLIVIRAGLATAAEPLPIDPLWKSKSFQRSITGSFGIDSRIEPRITEDEEFYLEKSAEEMAKGDRPSAIDTLTDSSLMEDSAAMRFSAATLQFEEGDLEGARGNLLAAIALFPNFRDAHRNLAVVYVQEEKYDEAETHLIRALELGARDGLTMGLLGYCHTLDENYQPALDAYRLAMLTQPEERQWKLGAAQSLQALKESRKAASIYDAIIKDDPAAFDIWLTQADALIDLDETEKAIANLELVARAGAIPARGYLSLGHLYFQSELPELGFERYRSALTAEEPVPLAKAVEALEVLTTNLQWEHARTLGELIAGSSPYRERLASGRAEVKVISRLTRSRALTELEIGNRDVGAKLVEEWIAQEPLDGLALILLARFREEADQREAAEMLLEQAQRIPDHASDAHVAHAELLVKFGDYTAAVANLEQALSIAPSERISDYLAAVRELEE